MRTSLRHKKGARLKLEELKIKKVITGDAIPKSLGLIELEKNYALLARMMIGIIERMNLMQNKMEKMEKKLVQLLRTKK